MKLQDAYVAESGTKVGNWKMIGYNMQNSTSFSYDQDALTSESTALEGLTKTGAWKATALAKLNDCKANETWTISVAENTSTSGTQGSPLVYTAEYSDATNCSPLTPNFLSIGK